MITVIIILPAVRFGLEENAQSKQVSPAKAGGEELEAAVRGGEVRGIRSLEELRHIIRQKIMTEDGRVA